MQIKIDTTYEIAPKFKKNFYEITTATHSNGSKAQFTEVYRDGSIYVTPQTQEEVKHLIDLINNKDSFDTNDFADTELSDAYDGCANDYDIDPFLEDLIENLDYDYDFELIDMLYEHVDFCVDFSYEIENIMLVE